MDKMLEEIEAMIIEEIKERKIGEKAIKMAVLKAKEAYSAMNMPSIILKNPTLKSKVRKKPVIKISDKRPGLTS